MEILMWITLGMVIGALIAVGGIVLLEVRANDRAMDEERKNEMLHKYPFSAPPAR